MPVNSFVHIVGFIFSNDFDDRPETINRPVSAIRKVRMCGLWTSICVQSHLKLVNCLRSVFCICVYVYICIYVFMWRCGCRSLERCISAFRRVQIIRNVHSNVGKCEDDHFLDDGEVLRFSWAFVEWKFLNFSSGLLIDLYVLVNVNIRWYKVEWFLFKKIRDDSFFLIMHI